MCCSSGSLPAIADTYSVSLSVTDATGLTATPVILPLVVQPTVSIESVTANQAIEAPDINNDGIVDLVAGRPTVFRVKGKVLGSNPSKPSTIMVQLGGLPSDTVSTDTFQTGVDFLINPGEVAQRISLIATASIVGISGPPTQKTFTADVRQVREVRLAYFQLNYLAPTPDYTVTWQHSQDFIQSAFPVDPNAFPIPTVNTPFDRSTCTSYFLGDLTDVICLWREGKKLNPAPERIVGIAPQTWFDTYASGATGVTYKLIPVSVVAEGNYYTAAHELGHTYGFGEGYTCIPFTHICTFDGALAPGYWVEKYPNGDFSPTDIVSLIPTLDYMGITPLPGVYAAGVSGVTTPFRWTTPDNFRRLFLNFISPPADPEVLLVTGIIHSDGTVTLGPVDRADTGTLTAAAPGDAALQLIDGKGNILFSLSFPFDVTVFDGPAVNAAPFGFSIPYVPGSLQLQIVRAGNTLARSMVATNLLVEAVVSIPDAGFDQNASQRRNALLNKISAFDAQLSAGATKGAENNLQNDIRKSLQDWLIDGYAVSSPLQYTKSQILALVDELIQQLGS